MKNINFPIVFGSLYGFLAIALGAYTDHALRDNLSAHDLDSMLTALRYQLIHALFLLSLGFAQRNSSFRIFNKVLNWAAMCCGLGILFFSGGIEISIVGHTAMALKIVPMGGMLLMTSWLVAGISGLCKR